MLILLPLVRGWGVGPGFRSPDPIKTLWQKNAAHMVMCLRQASGTIYRILLLIRGAWEVDGLLKKGVECNSRITDIWPRSFTILLVSLPPLFSLLLSPLPGSSSIVAIVNLLPATRQKPDSASFQVVYQFFIFSLNTQPQHSPRDPRG